MAISVKQFVPPAVYELPPPSTFGELLPAKFTEWRNDQPKSILTTVDSDRRFVAQAAPTGFGKSLMYIAIAQLTGWRTCILTSTKGLQEQLLADFNSDGTTRLVDIRGQNAYRCVAAAQFGQAEYTTCDFGACHAGRYCSNKDGGCIYFDQYRKALEARIVVTNYSYWLNINKHGQGLGKFDLIVLDECHDAPDILAEFMSVEIAPDEASLIGSKLMDPGCDIKQWANWAGYVLPKAQTHFDKLKSMVQLVSSSKTSRDMSTVKRLIGKLETLKEAADDWVIEKIDKRPTGYAMRFDPVWPYKFAESLLFRGVPKVMLVSATLRHKTAELLGIDESNLNFYDYDSSFPKARRPVIHIPTVQMNHRTPPENLKIWLQRIDQVIRNRQDRKGIIHTVSFARAKQIMDHSEFSHLMLLNESKNTKYIVERFKSSREPMILVSPSISTGYDFPFDECEYQIIGKLPFPDNRAAVIKARMENDKDFSNYITMQVLIQMCGRGMRAAADMCETLIIDDSIQWFMKHNGQKFAPAWFREALIWGNTMPKPLAKL